MKTKEVLYENIYVYVDNNDLSGFCTVVCAKYWCRRFRPLFGGKKAIIKETVQFTERENKAFWALYDEYMQTYVKLYKRRKKKKKGLLEDNKAISEKRAKTIVDEHFAIDSDSLKAKLSMLKKFAKYYLK